MRLIKCTQCGSDEFVRDNGFMICKYCGARFAVEKEDLGVRQSSISLDSDIEALLKKCRTDPRNAKRYANLILDIDPDNEEAYRYL